MIITRLIEHIVAIVGDIGTINAIIIEVLIEVYFKVITRRSTIFVRS